MNKVKRIAVVLTGVLIVCALFFTACGGDPAPDHPDVPAEKTVTRIAITEKPAKTTYLVGETFDKTGMVVTAYYDDGTSAAVTDYKLDKQGALVGGDTTVTVTYGGKVAMLSITVTIEVDEKLHVTDGENKVYTVEAEDLDYSHCVNSNDPDALPNVEIAGNASNMRSIASLSVFGNTFGFAVESDVEAGLTIVMRASAVTRDIDLDLNVDLMWNNSYASSGHILTWKEDYWGWEHAYYTDLTLEKGRNTLTARITTGLAPNIDCFYLIVAPTGEEVLGPGGDVPGEPPVYGTFLDIETDAAQSYTVEAEALDYSDCVSSNNPDETPNFERPSTPTSGDTCVSSLGVKGNRFGMAVSSAADADLSLTMVVSNGNPNDQALDDLMRVTWNGDVLKTAYTLKWEKDRWHHWERVTLSGLKLQKGAENVLDILITDFGAPNFDCFIFEVSPDKVDPAPEPVYATFLNVTDAGSQVYTVEAEALDYSGCVNSNNPDAPPNTETPSTLTSGRLCVSSLGVNGNTFGMTVGSTVSADLSVVLRVSSGTNADQVLDDLLEIKWNGAVLKTATTVAYEDDVWHNWQHVYLNGLMLNAEDNVLSVKVVGGGSPNFDCFYFIVSPTGEETPGPEAGSDEIPAYGTFLSITDGAAATYTVEAEELDYSGCINSNNHAIQPNVERPETVTSGGASVGGLGVTGNRFGFTVNSTVEGTVTLYLVVSSGSGAEQIVDDALEIRWNGEKTATGHTLSWDGKWHQWETVAITGLTLNAGDNVLDITVVGGSPNFDCFRFDVEPQKTADA